mmetsp:Transcript_9954/g.12078  ORF Transcript_9954/g.12078 Transcript_9954/m.12078 type:complete len:719 (-) Transcript_9954:135-2291(-)
MAIGASTMAKKKAIVTHLTALQEIASMKVLCSDKTGTLTTANMTIITDKIWCAEGFTTEQVLTWAAVASNPNNKEDPIDQAVFRGFETYFGQDRAEDLLADYPITQFMGFNPVVKRTVVRTTYMSQPMVISKGLLNKVLDTHHGLDGTQVATGENDGGELQWKVERLNEIVEEVREADIRLALAGYKTIAVVVRYPPTESQPHEGPMVLAGIVPMLDPPRIDTALTLHRIRDAQIDVKMVTGDHLNIAKETSKLINLGTNILPATSLWPVSFQRNQSILNANGFAQVLPKDKKEIIMVLQTHGGDGGGLVVGMTGDGVNDAPALSQAHIGIAVDGATEAAKASADIILTTPGLSAIFDAIVESRKIFQRLLSYILYRMAATIQIVLVLTLLIVFYDHMIDPLYVILLALFNDVTMAPISSDNALPSKKPDIPTIKYIIGMSLVFGLLSTLQTMIYYNSPNLWDVPTDHATGKVVDLNNVHEHTQIDINDHRHANIWDVRSGATYVQISIAVELLIFSCRTTGWFFMDLPSLGLISGVMIANMIVSFCAVYGVIVTPRLDWSWIANIWIYNIGCLFIIDSIKIIVNKIINNSHNDILGYSELPMDNEEGGRLTRSTFGEGGRSMNDDGSIRSDGGGGGDVDRSSVLSSRRSSRQIHGYSSRTSHMGDYSRASYRSSYMSSGRRSSNLRRNVPGNLAQDFDQHFRGGDSMDSAPVFWQGW